MTGMRKSVQAPLHPVISETLQPHSNSAPALHFFSHTVPGVSLKTHRHRLHKLELRGWLLVGVL